MCGEFRDDLPGIYPVAGHHCQCNKSSECRHFRYTSFFAKKIVLIRNQICIEFLLENIEARKLGSNAFITGPGRYRKVDEKQRNTSANIAGRNSATLRSYVKNK